MMKEDKIHTPEQASVILDRGLRYVYKLLREKKITSEKIGRYWYIKESDLQEYIENKRRYIKQEKIEGKPEPQPDCMFYQTCGRTKRCQILKECYCVKEARKCKFFKSRTERIEKTQRAIEHIQEWLSEPNSLPSDYLDSLRMCKILLNQEKYRLLNPEV